MDRVSSNSATKPSITAEELDKLVAVADKAKLKAYGMTVCAERTAVFRAVSEGVLSFRAIVITTDITDGVVFPCGACRQVMSEFGNLDVYCLQPNGKVTRTTLEDLMPQAFSSTQLSKGQQTVEDE